MTEKKDFDQEIFLDFVTECRDLLDEVEPELLNASNNLSIELANKIFRPIHSFKGAASSLGLDFIAKLAHAAESLLSLFRSGDYVSDSDTHLGIFLQTFDLLRLMLDKVEHYFTDKGFESEALELTKKYEVVFKATINHEIGNKDVSIEIPEEEYIKIEINQEMLDGFIAESIEGFDLLEQKLFSLMKNLKDKEALEDVFRNIHSFKGNCGIFAFKDLEKLSHRLESLLECLMLETIETTVSILEMVLIIVDVLRKVVIDLKKDNKESSKVDNVDLYIQLIDDVTNKKSANKVIEETKETKKLEKPATKAESEKQNIRVDIKKLDELNNLVGELVTAKTMILGQAKRMGSDEQFTKAYRFLDRTISDLQDIAMDIRMVPVSSLFNRMIRVVHDLKKKLRKEVNLNIFGELTEVDKTLLEKISDPMVHIVRNAVDHGIETPEERTKLGKNPIGTVTLGAKHEAGEIWIIIKDDGKGLNRKKIYEKAISLKMLNNKSYKECTDQDLFQLIFSPGFSTAEKITDVSGRGVGMDVVSQNIRKLKGRTDISSEEGKGSTITLKIPLTLSIMDSMLLRVGNIQYSMPIENIIESIKVTNKGIVSVMDGQKLVNFRDNMVPIVLLNELHNVSATGCSITDGVVVILEAKGFRIGLLVDELIGQHQTVIKALPDYLRILNGISSCSILGNGEVSLILDPTSLVDFALSKNMRMEC